MNWLMVWVLGFVAAYLFLGTKVIAVMLLCAVLFGTLLGAAVGSIGIVPGVLLGLAFGFYVGLRRDFVA